MQCPECGATMYCTDSKLVARHDDTPDERTEIYRVQTLVCHNKQCAHTKTIETLENPIDAQA